MNNIKENNTNKKEIMGYQIEVVEDSNIAYKLHGKRGGVFRLIRNIEAPHTMYVINGNGNITALKGNYTFTDQGGDLRPHYGVIFV